MKIRTDFVTNSSSVSYIVTMSKNIIDILNKFHEGVEKNPKTNRIFELLHNEMLKSGTRVVLEGEEIYTKKFKFQTYGDCMWDDSFDKPVEEIDFLKMSDEELWAYIFGEYFLNGKICQIRGFGATNVETY